MDTKLIIYNIGKRLLNPLLNDETKFYLKTWYFSRKDKHLFKRIRTYCMFIGSGRTGHSLVASLIDAHPNAIVSNELNTLKFVKKGFSKNMLFSMIIRNSQLHAEQGRTWTGYAYTVKDQMQGSFTELMLIGDKKGGVTSEILSSEPDLLKKIMKEWRVEFRFVHVIRNPYDAISSIARGGQLMDKDVDEEVLTESIQRFFLRMDNVMELKGWLESSILDIKHEEFIKDPSVQLMQILKFLGLEWNEKYLEDCSSIVNRKPSLSREKVKWPDTLIALVKSKSENYPFLADYTF